MDGSAVPFPMKISRGFLVWNIIPQSKLGISPLRTVNASAAKQNITSIRSKKRSRSSKRAYKKGGLTRACAGIAGLVAILGEPDRRIHSLNFEVAVE